MPLTALSTQQKLHQEETKCSHSRIHPPPPNACRSGQSPLSSSSKQQSKQRKLQIAGRGGPSGSICAILQTGKQTHPGEGLRQKAWMQSQEVRPSPPGLGLPMLLQTHCHLAASACISNSPQSSVWTPGISQPERTDTIWPLGVCGRHSLDLDTRWHRDTF